MTQHSLSLVPMSLRMSYSGPAGFLTRFSQFRLILNGITELNRPRNIIVQPSFF